MGWRIVNSTGQVKGETGGGWQVITSTGYGKQDVLDSGIDHGSLGGLADDDHTQYPLLAGRSGGQTLTGGTASSNGLILDSTSNSTKGVITLGGAGSGSNTVIGGGTSASELRLLEASGSGTNYTALKAQAQIGNVTYTLPAADAASSGFQLTSNASGTLSWAAAGGFTLGTEQASTSGTSITFTGIPAGTKVIYIMFNAVSTNGTSVLLLQIGDSGGPEASGYTGRSTLLNGGAQTANGAGFRLVEGGNASASFNGMAILTLEDSTQFTWMEVGQVTDEVAIGQTSGCGTKSLDAELDRVVITTVNGTDAFDAGAINISYIG
jgi:hypothetical protein